MTALPAPLPHPASAVPFRLVRPPACEPHALLARLLIGWLVLRTALWTLLAWLQPNPALDTVEWLAWGRQWQLGYHKHPPLAAWLAEMAWQCGGGSFLGVYLLGYTALAAALYGVWLVARDLLPARAALVAVLALDGLSYLGSYGSEYNNQVLLIAFWALTITFFHRASRDDRPRDWLLAGLMMGLAALCKYSTVTLAAPLLAWHLWTADWRRWQGPALLLAAAGLVFLPHLLWLVQHDFPTLRYAARRLGSEATAPSGLAPLEFLASQAGRLLPALVLAALLLRPRWRGLDAAGRQARAMLTVAVAGPVLLTFALSLLGGTQLRSIWGAPLWTFAPLLLVLCVDSDESARAWRRFRLGWASLVGVLLAITLASSLFGSALQKRPIRIHYPGSALAGAVTEGYRQRHGTAPAVLAGDWWLAGNVCCLASHRPTLYGSREPSGIDLSSRSRRDPEKYAAPDPLTCPWSSDDDLHARGGVLVWSAEFHGAELPDFLRRRFPAAEVQPALTLVCRGGSKRTLEVGWALLAPATR